MANLSLSTDANIRGQLMLQLRSITNSNLFDVTEKIKEIFCQRARDKIVKEKRKFVVGQIFLFVQISVGGSKRNARIFGASLQERVFDKKLVRRNSEEIDLDFELHHSFVFSKIDSRQVRIKSSIL